jgi:BirA family biotin operon repressor/biotin-[acetyl-CoA-carboxylase] ligase
MSGQAARFTVRRFVDIDSTQRYALDEARRGAPARLVAVADHQSAGRGRLGRRWEAPPGSNLLMSVLLRPTMPVEELHLCTVVVALAALDACASVAGVDAELKWPNDLMVGDRKLAGVLAEAVAGTPPGPPIAAVVVGIGVNVRWPPPGSSSDDPADTELEDTVFEDTVFEDTVFGDTAPDDTEPDHVDATTIARRATSLERESGTPVEPGALLEGVLVHLGRRLADLDSVEGRRRLTSEYRERCATLGRRVRVSTSTTTITGVATGVTDEGHLVVDVGGTSTTVAAGDVVHLRDVR